MMNNDVYIKCRNVSLLLVNRLSVDEESLVLGIRPVECARFAAALAESRPLKSVGKLSHSKVRADEHAERSEMAFQRAAAEGVRLSESKSKIGRAAWVRRAPLYSIDRLVEYGHCESGKHVKHRSLGSDGFTERASMDRSLAGRLDRPTVMRLIRSRS
jgi:hypothetical protein